MRKIALLTIAKKNSIRLPNKNKISFFGKPLFLWNVEKGLKISKNYFFNSDDKEILETVSKLKVKTIIRNNKLIDDEIPSRIIFKDCFKNMPNNIEGILHIQANSPNIHPGLIKTAFEIMKNTDVQELLTCDIKYQMYGSLWGITRKRLSQYNMNKNINDRKVIKPDCYLLDTSVDIHTKKDLVKSKKKFDPNKKY